jgi:hypothetical protein
LQLLLPFPAGHGDGKKARLPLAFCSERGDRGMHKFNHAGGNLASTIFCRHGGDYITSDAEALL